jgi:hypothetical protein
MLAAVASQQVALAESLSASGGGSIFMYACEKAGNKEKTITNPRIEPMIFEEFDLVIFFFLPFNLRF